MTDRGTQTPLLALTPADRQDIQAGLDQLKWWQAHHAHRSRGKDHDANDWWINWYEQLLKEDA